MKRKSKTLIKDNRGSIAVETTLIFVPFVVIVISVLSLINIVTLQARVSYAMTQAALTLSKYSYVLEITGLADEFKAADEHGAVARAGVNDIKNNIGKIVDGISGRNGVSGTIGQISVLGDAGAAVINDSIDLLSNPSNLFQMILTDAKDVAFSELARQLVGRYLSNGNMNTGSFIYHSGNKYLESMKLEGGIEDLEFYNFEFYTSLNTTDNNSRFIDSNGDITIIVTYSVPYIFTGFRLPFNALNITQTVSTKAWLGGSGVRYTG